MPRYFTLVSMNETGVHVHFPLGYHRLRPQSSRSVLERESLLALGDREILKEGWVHKWGNFIKGYDQRWLVLYSDRLVYYKDWDNRSSYRGCISLMDADIQKNDYFGFIITNREDITFKCKAESEFEQHSWISAIEFAKAKLISKHENSEAEFEEEEPSTQKDQADIEKVVQTFDSKLERLNGFNSLIIQQSEMLQAALIRFLRLSKECRAGEAIKECQTHAPMYMATCAELTKHASEFLEFAQAQESRWKKTLVNNLEHKVVLEDMVEQMATQQNHLEKLAMDKDHHEFQPFGESASNLEKEVFLPSSSGSDCTKWEMSKQLMDDYEPNRNVKLCVSSEAFNTQACTLDVSEPVRKRRSRIPNRPHKFHIKLWAILKHSLHGDVIPLSLPVYFNEPLTMLQRVTEMYENYYILDLAAKSMDVYEQMANIGAFVIAGYSANVFRANKPFVPFVGETYECDRTDDLKWRCVSECIGHDPLVILQHCEGENWELTQELRLVSRFRGQSVEVYPGGACYLKVRSSDMGTHTYSWERPGTGIHNMMIGVMWVMHHGTVEVLNHQTQDKAFIKFVRSHVFYKKHLHCKVYGAVKDKSGDPKWLLNGTWDSKIDGAKVLDHNIINHQILVRTASPVLLWLKGPEDGCSQMYYFGSLARQLNEPEPGVPPTDSRHRTDVRLLEEGSADASFKAKTILSHLNKKVSPSPAWFEMKPPGHIPSYHFTGKYWKCKEQRDWARCPKLTLELDSASDLK